MSILIWEFELGSKQTPIFVLKIMLKSGVRIFKPYFNSSCSWFHMFNVGSILGEQKQRKVVRLSEVGEGCYPICFDHIGVDTIQNFMSPSETRFLVTFKEKRS